MRGARTAAMAAIAAYFTGAGLAAPAIPYKTLMLPCTTQCRLLLY